MTAEEQLKTNYESFMQKLPDLLATHRDKFALMHDGEIVEFFDTAVDTFRAGQRLYQDQGFSIQEVTDSEIDLGFFSYAVPHGTV
jgi:hypothetical protein